jgi:hypothetical protein
MDWFESLTGFREGSYDETRQKLAVRDGRLFSRVNGRSFGIGKLEMLSLGGLRAKLASLPRDGRLEVGNVSGDVRKIHRDASNRRSLFQVASQFNLLEMTSYSVSPEDGVTRYAGDPTQGPACAIAAGAATIYRNYFAPVDGHAGQTAGRQVDAAAKLRAALAALTGIRPEELWVMTNGYALPTSHGLRAAADALQRISTEERERLKDRLEIGLHWDVEVTDGAPPEQVVSQAFCSAMPVSYSGLSRSAWEPLARLVLEAAYEATLAAAVLNAVRAGTRTVFLTRLGGGAFGNDDQWIDDAMQLAFQRFRSFGLKVRLVSHGAVTPAMKALAAEFDPLMGHYRQATS